MAHFFGCNKKNFLIKIEKKKKKLQKMVQRFIRNAVLMQLGNMRWLKLDLGFHKNKKEK